MKIVRCLLPAFFALPFFCANAQQVLGERSQKTLHRIEEINVALHGAQQLGGLLAVYGLTVEPPGGTEASDVADAIATVNDVAGTDADSYTTIANYVNGLNAIQREAVQNEIGQLIFDDESSHNELLTDAERDFWNALQGNVDRAIAEAQTHGEPHLKTFDGYSYDLQAVGEFVLCKSSKQFEIQVRQKPLDQNVSINTAVAMNVHGQKIAFYADDFPDNDKATPLRINGVPRKFKSKFIVLPHGGAIEKLNESEYMVFWETGEKAFLKFYPYLNTMIDVVVTVPAKEKNMHGLLGNNNQLMDDDLRTGSGTLLKAESWKNDIQKYIGFGNTSNQFGKAEKEFNKQLVNKFAYSWLLTNESSFFSYAQGKTTKSFYKKEFPLSFHSIADLTPEQLQKAKDACKGEGVADENMQACIYDVAFTGQIFFTKSNAYLTKTNSILNTAGIQTPLNKIPEVKKHMKEKLKSKARKIITHF